MAQRQRWEYCEVTPGGVIIYYASSGDHPREHLEEFPDDRDGRVRRAAALLGEWGWEAYGTSAEPYTAGSFFFKRPIE